MKENSQVKNEQNEGSAVEYVVVDRIYLDKNVSSDLCSEFGLLFEKRDRFEKIPASRYEYRIDSPAGIPRPGNLRHVHIFNNGKQIFAMNIDGTAHDGFHRVRIPQEIADVLRKKGFTIPANNLIEMVMQPIVGKQLLCD